MPRCTIQDSTEGVSDGAGDSSLEGAMDPFSTQLFVFTSRRRTQCRILYWERCGFVQWQPRLERARFAWPRRADAVVNLSGTQLSFLLDGYDIWRMRPHQQLHYASMY